MFSDLGRRGHSVADWERRENVLDVLQRAGVRVLWRDNNSGSKGVAARVDFADFSTSARNPVCDFECRDIGMLDGLDALFDTEPTRDTLIVLHQAGSHGPLYEHRYPQTERHFRPACRTNHLERCTRQEIDNAYDNSIRYTDAFLAAAIDLLRRHDAPRHRALIYVGDHGESLGEHGWYLHGLPYAIAPREQIRVPLIVWLSDDFDDARKRIAMRTHAHYSHDDLFHSLLGIFQVDTALYDRARDIFASHYHAE